GPKSLIRVASTLTSSARLGHGRSGPPGAVIYSVSAQRHSTLRDYSSAVWRCRGGTSLTIPYRLPGGRQTQTGTRRRVDMRGPPYNVYLLCYRTTEGKCDRDVARVATQRRHPTTPRRYLAAGQQCW